MLAFELHPQHHDDVGVADGFADVGGEPDAGRQLLELAGQQRRGTAKHDLRAELGEQVHVRTRDAAMRNVADDGHSQAFERAATDENGAGVEQRLGRVLVHAIAGVNDGGGQVPRQEMRRPGSCVAHHDRVRPHRRQGVQSVHQRLAFGDA